MKATDIRSEIATYGVGKYLKLTPSNFKVLICPSDPNPSQRQDIAGVVRGGYPFSYQVNWALGCRPSGSIAPAAKWGGPWYREKITQVKNASEKVLLIEADERYATDGQTALSQQQTVVANWCNLLATRHDSIYRKRADWVPDGKNGDNIINSPGKGNAAFCDGHAEYVPRSRVHSRAASMPNPNVDCPTGWKEPTMMK